MEVVDGRPWNNPRPLGEGDYGAFFAFCAKGELTYQECDVCGHRQHFPRPMCIACGEVPTTRLSAGLGSVYTYTVVRRTPQVPFNVRVPYVVAVVQIEEGPRMLGNVTDVAIEHVAVGLRVEAYAVLIDEDRAVPSWRPVKEHSLTRVE